MNEAYKKVCANKGAGGVDGMEIDELDGYIRGNWESIKEQIRKRSYTPQPVRRVEIPSLTEVSGNSEYRQSWTG